MRLAPEEAGCEFKKPGFVVSAESVRRYRRCVLRSSQAFREGATGTASLP